MNKKTILVVDDEPDIRELICEILIDEGFHVVVAKNADEAKNQVISFNPDVILLDIWMPEVDGITLLKEFKQKDNINSTIIMMSGHGNVETAVEATKYGAYDFIEKPLSIAKLLLTIKHAIEYAHSKNENLKPSQFIFNKLEPIGGSKKIIALRKQLSRIAKPDAPVFIYGQSGTNKELYARYIHSLSSRKNGPFISLNVSTLNIENAEVELFGLEMNKQLKTGYFDKALGGTIYIKDIGDLPAKLQLFFFNVLETKKYSHIGNSNLIEFNVRIISSTKYNIKQFIDAGRFREDLYYLLNVLPVNIPSLCEHYEDIPMILDYYVNYFVENNGLPYRHFSVAAQNRLRSYEWPGNIRELKNLVQRLLILNPNETIDVDEIEQNINSSDTHTYRKLSDSFDLPLRDARNIFEKRYLEYQLDKASGNISKVAVNIGIERTHLYRKLKALGINLK